jgi:hypothetical protein
MMLELSTLKERQHQTDMIQTFKKVRGIDIADYNTWIQLAAETRRATRSADDPLNLMTIDSRV